MPRWVRTCCAASWGRPSTSTGWKTKTCGLQLATCASGHSTSAFLLDPVRLRWKKCVRLEVCFPCSHALSSSSWHIFSNRGRFYLVAHALPRITNCLVIAGYTSLTKPKLCLAACAPHNLFSSSWRIFSNRGRFYLVAHALPRITNSLVIAGYTSLTKPKLCLAACALSMAATVPGIIWHM